MFRFPESCLWRALSFLTAVQQVAQHEAVILEFNPKDHLHDDLIKWHRKTYAWHHNDTIRSYTQRKLRAHGNNGKRTDFAYFNRATEYFGYDQFSSHRAQPNKLMCLWDPSMDGDTYGEHNPCLVLVKFLRDGRHLNLTAIYRKRDLLKRMVGNLHMLTLWLNSEAKERRLKAGTITDFSMEATYDEDALQQQLKKLKGK